MRIIIASLCLLCFAEAQTVPVILAPAPIFYSNLSNGKPNALGCVFTYASQTVSPLASYTDSSGATQNQNPVILSISGTAQIWLQAGLAYTFVVKSAGGLNCAAGSTQYTVNGIAGGTSQIVSAVAFSTVPTFTVISQNQLFTMTLTGNASVQPLAVVGVAAPSLITFRLTQDNIGSHTFAWPANSVGGAPIGLAANQVSTQMFVWDGTNALAIGPGITGTGPAISTGAITAAGNLAVTGTSSATGNGSFGGTLTVTGNSLTVGGNNVPQVLFKDGTAHSHTGTVTADTIYTIPIPALTTTSMLRISMGFRAGSQAAGITFVQLKLNGTLLDQVSIVNANQNQDISYKADMLNRNSLTSQEFSNAVMFGAAATSTAQSSPAANTTGASNLVLTVQNNAVGDGQTFNYILVELL